MTPEKLVELLSPPVVSVTVPATPVVRPPDPLSAPTVRLNPLRSRVLPDLSCRPPMVRVVSKLTLLVPFVMRTLVELPLGTKAGFQSPLVLHLPFPAMFQVVGLLSVHCASAERGEKQRQGHYRARQSDRATFTLLLSRKDDRWHHETP